MYDSVFELVDQWTTTAEADEYKAFIEALGFRVKYTGQQGSPKLRSSLSHITFGITPFGSQKSFSLFFIIKSSLLF